MKTTTTAITVLMLLGPAGCAGLPAPSGYECAGNACGSLSVKWDESRQQHAAQNNGDRWVKVTLQDSTASVTVRVPPGGQYFIGFVGPDVRSYRADYEEE